MKKRTEVKWSEIARRALWEYVQKLELMDSLLKDSKLTEEDVLELGDKIKEGIAKRYKE